MSGRAVGVKRWLYLHLTWMGRQERRLVREYVHELQAASEAYRARRNNAT